jgi:ABC-type sugar transport system ATPase subunit
LAGVPSVLELNELQVSAGDFRLQDISLEVAQNECHVVLGPTGSGKSVLLEAILGLRRVDSGKISLDGNDITALPVEQRQLGYVPQDLALFPHLTVRQNIEFSQRVNQGHALAADRIDALVEALAIGHLLERVPTGLSGGERQRVALVRAMASGSRLLLLDEPFSALNESLRKDLWLMIRELQRHYAMTLLMITHDLEEAFFLGASMSVLIDGRLHQSADRLTVYHQPASLEVASYFGIKNLYPVSLIEVEDDACRVYCESLASELVTGPAVCRHNSGERDSVHVGIRANEVMVLREDFDPARWSNTLAGTVSVILDKGASYTVLFEPDEAPGRVEIELNSHAFRRLHLHEGARRFVSLKQENLFLVSSTASQAGR